MNNFVLNSASVPIFSDCVDKICDQVFNALSGFIDKDNSPLLFIECEIDKIVLKDKYSLYDYCQCLPKRDRDLADFLIQYLDRAIVFELPPNVLFNGLLLVGDDTRFSKNQSLKYAFLEDEYLLSITEDSVWKRETIECILQVDKNTYNKGLYNVFSSSTKHLPRKAKPFSLYGNSDFIKTGFHYRNQAVFFNNKTQHYWYKDYFHRDTNPHYEVFDQRKKHIGEADVLGNLHKEKADKSKILRI